MQKNEKRDGVLIGVASSLKGLDADAVAAMISALQEIIKKIEENAPLSAVRQAYTAPLDTLVKLAGQEKDVNMLARLHGVMSILEADDSAAGQKEMAALITQLGQVEKMLQERASRSKPAAKGIIADRPAAAPPPIEIQSSPASYCEDVLRSLPSIGDWEIGVLKAQGLLDEEKLLSTDALQLAQIVGMTTNAALEVKEHLRREVEQRAKRDLERRVAELSMINEQLSAECDRITEANNTLLINNKNLKNQYPAISEQNDLEVKNFKELQSRVVSARLESNRLSTEINFLREEHQKLLDLVEEKHLVLDDLFRRFRSIRSSFEFVSGETAFAQDIMTNVEGLLNRALMQKRLLNDKIASSEESIEKLFSEFNEIVSKGKKEFYRSI